MKITPKIAAAAIAALALGGAGAGTALAAGHSGAATTSVASAEPTSPDHDSLQQGDQTSPDNAGAAAANAASSAKTTAPHVRGAASDDENGSESEQPSDGPGGHADPSGAVQHEFAGVE
jgi:hypothetical protein